MYRMFILSLVMLSSFSLSLEGNFDLIISKIQEKSSGITRQGDFVIHNEGVGVINLGYRFRDFIHEFSDVRIEINTDEPEGLGLMTRASFYYRGSEVPDLEVSSEMLDYGDPTPELDRKVFAIFINSSMFQTSEGIGVGSTVRDLLGVYTFGEASFSEELWGEGEIFPPTLSIVVQEYPNMTFLVRNVHLKSQNPAVSDLPLNAEISSIYITYPYGSYSTDSMSVD